MKACGSAFLLFDSKCASADYECFDDGMTLREYAAIKLKFPKSGAPELDAMIRESRRADFAQEAMRIIVEKRMNWPESSLRNDWADFLAYESYVIADAMLAEWDKQGEERNESS
jgi:hypothetical protein